MVVSKLVVESCPVRVTGVGIGSLLALGEGAGGSIDDCVRLRVTSADGDRAEVLATYHLPHLDRLHSHQARRLTLRRAQTGVACRWLWRCPRCGASVRELAAPPRSTELGCRSCLAWTYRSRASRHDLSGILAREDRVLDQLRRARSPKRIRRLQVRASGLTRKRFTAIAAPTVTLLNVLASVTRCRTRSGSGGGGCGKSEHDLE